MAVQEAAEGEQVRLQPSPQPQRCPLPVRLALKYKIHINHIPFYMLLYLLLLLLLRMVYSRWSRSAGSIPDLSNYLVLCGHQTLLDPPRYTCGDKTVKGISEEQDRSGACWTLRYLALSKNLEKKFQHSNAWI